MSAATEEKINPVEPVRLHQALGIYQSALIAGEPDAGGEGAASPDEPASLRAMLAVKREFPDPKEYLSLSLRLQRFTEIVSDKKFTMRSSTRSRLRPSANPACSTRTSFTSWSRPNTPGWKRRRRRKDRQHRVTRPRVPRRPCRAAGLLRHRVRHSGCATVRSRTSQRPSLRRRRGSAR
jgi:hypothetical protein